MDSTMDELEIDYNNLKDRLITLQKELEVKNSQLSDCKSQLTLVSEREKHYLHEIESLQSDEQPEANKLESKLDQLQEEFFCLEHHLNSELNNSKEEVVRLQKKLKLHENVANDSDSLQASNDEISEENLPLFVEVLRSEVYEKQLFMDVLEEKNTQLAGSIRELEAELIKLKQNADCKDQDLVEVYAAMSTLQEDLLRFKGELESARCRSTQPDCGNSLFAEVNDRRLEMQQMLINLKRKCNEMKEQTSITQKQMSTLRLHNDELLHLLKNDPLECLHEYETLIATYKDRISILKNLSTQNKSLLLERQKLLDAGLPRNVVEFVNDNIAEKRRAEEKLNETTSLEFRAQKMMSLQLRETNLKVQDWKKTNEQLWNKVLELEDTLQNLQLEEKSVTTDSKPIIVEEKSSAIALVNDNEATKGILKVVDKHENKLIDENDKENSVQEIDVDERKVKFTVDTVDPKPSNKHPLRKGGKVLQQKTIHIKSVIKK